MNYWLDLFTPYTWQRFLEHGADVSGFNPRQRRTAYEAVNDGDILLCYIVKLSRWSGTLVVKGPPFEDLTPIFTDSNDPFTIRFHVEPKVLLREFENAIPINEPEIWNGLSLTQNLERGSVSWAQRARLRKSLVPLTNNDGHFLEQTLVRQCREMRVYPLDSADRRHIRDRTVVRTEQGEVEVEVPDREESALEVEKEILPTDHKESHLMQAKIARLGATLGFAIWIPPADRHRVADLMSPSDRQKIAARLPVNFDLATIKTIENIDVIWLEKRAIAHAFEVEHTTAVYSGLLRMADLLAMQPRINISLHIVAPLERRDRVRREILRPVFSVLEGGAMSERCSFISYEALDEILSQPNLTHMRETILEDYEEYFEA